jgi:hypothetical protein
VLTDAQAGTHHAGFDAVAFDGDVPQPQLAERRGQLEGE